VKSLTSPITIDRALLDKQLLGAALGDPASWSVWLSVLCAAFGLVLNREQRRLFASVAGDRKPPEQRVRELWAIVGRRGGKSRMAGALAVYLAAFVKHKLAPGERGMVLVLAASLEQSKIVFGYVRGFLDASPALRKEVVNATAHEITLKNGICIAVHSNSFRTLRGRTLVACVLDEVSYWRDESTANPDVEAYTAILPALLTTRGMLVGISTPYRKMGLLHQKHRDHFAQDGADVLVVQGSSLTFNPSLDPAGIEAQRAADPTAAGSEWDAEFRSDIGTFLDDELIDAAIDYDRPIELPPVAGVTYKAFTDTNGGTGGDSYTLCICHKEKTVQGDRLIIDVLRGTKGKIDTHATTAEYARLCQEYGVHTVVGDKYAADWVKRTWMACHMGYTQSPRPKSELYLEVIPLFLRGMVRLPNHALLLRELRLLERRTHRSGRDEVNHPNGGHDDYANAVCGALALLGARLSVDVPPEEVEKAMAIIKSYKYTPPNPLLGGMSGRVGERKAAQIRRRQQMALLKFR
jgi:hypothetical protein